MQLEATGKENTEIQEAQALQISEMEERLKVANEDKEHLKAEGRKMKAHSKVLTAALRMQARCFGGRGGGVPARPCLGAGYFVFSACGDCFACRGNVNLGRWVNDVYVSPRDS